MFTFDKANDPNPGRLIGSLRSLGYNNYQAIADLVDNCFDADATAIRVTINQRSGDFIITIADDGAGMDQATLDQALRLGSLTDRNVETDLGKFGMGLVTASLSLARRTVVITKQGDEFWTSAVDVDEIQRENRFCKHLAPSSDEEKSLFCETVGGGADSGTLVILSRTDGITNRNTTQFGNILKKHLGEVHRFFLMAGKVIVVNDDEIAAIDPLMLEDPDTELFSDDLYPFEVHTDGQTSVEHVRVRIALIPDNPAAGEHEISKGINNQGFYILRNNRQIARAEHLNLFTKHNDFNRMRGEIYFPGKFDSLIGIEFTKRHFVFHQSIQDKLTEHVKGQCTTIKRRESRRNIKQTTPDEEKLHQLAAKAITEKSRLLMTPKAVIEKRKGPGNNGKPSRDPSTATGKERKNLRHTQLAERDTRVRFRHQELGPNGAIFECDMEGRTVVVRWNIDHPFYRRFVADNQHDDRLVTAIDFLVYSMACAELRERNDENIQLLNNQKAVVSANLRTLLS